MPPHRARTATPERRPPVRCTACLGATRHHLRNWSPFWQEDGDGRGTGWLGDGVVESDRRREVGSACDGTADRGLDEMPLVDDQLIREAQSRIPGSGSRGVTP